MDAVRCIGWDELDRIGPDVDAIVVCQGVLGTGEAWRELVALAERRGRPPLVLVTGFSKRNVEYIGKLRLDEVVSTDDVETRLGAVLERYSTRDPLLHARGLIRSSSLPAPFRDALDYVLTAERSPRTVARWAGATGIHRTTLYLYFNAHTPDLTPKDVLDWIILVRLASLARGRRWARCAGHLGLHEDTLSRLTARLLDRTPAEASKLAVREVSALFRERVVGPLIGSTDRQPFDSRFGVGAPEVETRMNGRRRSGRTSSTFREVSMHRSVPFVLALLVAACADATAPPEHRLQGPSDEPLTSVADRIHAVAATDIPIPHDGAYRIAIPAASLTHDAAIVRYYSPSSWAAYQFRNSGAGWVRGALIEEGTFESAVAREGGILPQGYSQTIATLRNEAGSIRDNDWLITNKTAGDRGWNWYSEEYQTDLPFEAEFIGGTETSSDTTFEVQFPSGAEWKGERLTTPTGTKTCSTTTCPIYFNYTDSNGFLADTGSERVTLKYWLRVIVPVSASISGETLIKKADDYTWTATASGGDGSSYSYQWEEREQGGSWAVVGSGSTYSRFVPKTDAGKTFELRVTVTSGGRTGSATHTYQVSADIEDPLVPTINGTTSITQAGNYTWTSSVTGGEGSYSYSWEYCQNGCSVVSTANSYTRYVALNDGEFTLFLTVTASAGQQQTATDDHYVYVAYDGGVLRAPNGSSK